MKNNNLMKKLISSILIFTILILSSLFAVFQCLKIDSKIESKMNNYFIGERQSYFLSKLNDYNLGLYYENLKLDSDKDPINLMVDVTTEEEYQFANTKIFEINQNLLNENRNLRYYAINRDTQKVVTNADELSVLLESNYDKYINDNNMFYVLIDYDINGKVTISNYKNETNDGLISANRNFQNSMNFYYDGRLNAKPIKNMSFIYAYPSSHNITSYDSTTPILESFRFTIISTLAEKIGVFGAIFILLLALIIPFKLSRNLPFFNLFSKLPFEIIFALALIVLGLYGGSCTDILYGFVDMIVLGDGTKIIQILGTTLYLFLYFALIFYIALILKHIWNIGIKTYFREKSLIGKALRFIGRNLKEFIKTLLKMDLKNKNTKLFVLIIGGNFIIMCLLCSIWFFGIIGAIIYSIALFLYATKKYNRISEDYNKLLKGTNTMVSGNLNSFPLEDMGIFNSLRDDLQNIEKGFKKAVDLEVQSQKMKTELISNVSHDLKTPLTAIISYIDLIKEEDISPEICKEYVDTLDRKAQRLKYLIEDLFEVSKATSGNITMNFMDVDVVSLMKQTILEQEHNIINSEIKFKTSYPMEKVILSLDSQRTFRVFENLIVNITKYAMPNSRAYIEIVNNENTVDIFFKNMSKDELNFSAEEIVERFVRGDKARNTEGSGLGLAIAKSFVELQRGDFDISIDGDLFKVRISFHK
ncbi:MAG: sensor histidine kinase [Clostridium sp.]